MTDPQGKLPLFVALANHGTCWNRDVILKLADASPGVLQRLDDENKLFPVLLAATTLCCL